VASKNVLTHTVVRRRLKERLRETDLQNDINARTHEPNYRTGRLCGPLRHSSC